MLQPLSAAFSFAAASQLFFLFLLTKIDPLDYQILNDFQSGGSDTAFFNPDKVTYNNDNFRCKYKASNDSTINIF